MVSIEELLEKDSLKRRSRDPRPKSKFEDFPIEPKEDLLGDIYSKFKLRGDKPPKTESYINNIEPFPDFNIEKPIYKKLSGRNNDHITNFIHPIENIFKKYNSLGSNVGIGITYNSLKVYPKRDEISAEGMGEIVLPIVEYVRQIQPDFIVANDRGGRMVGVAVGMLYRGLHGTLPTTDGTMRFRRFSKSNNGEETKRHVEPLVQEMLESADNPTVLVLDDWVASGATKDLVEGTFRELGDGRIDVKYGVLTGGPMGVDVSGDSNSPFGSVLWRDDSTITGVDYDGTKAFPVRTVGSVDYRRAIRKGIRETIERINSETRELVEV